MFVGLYNITEFKKNEDGFNASVHFNSSHFIYKAHFPDNPVTPGVCIIQIAKELLEYHYGCTYVMNRASNVKYINIIDPRYDSDVVYGVKCSRIGKLVKATIVVSTSDKIFVKISMECSEEDIFEKLKIYLLVPTYNNATKLGGVLDSLLTYTSRIIVVNDGSTDNTLEVLNSYSDKITIINYAKNRGKGYAIKQGFKRCKELGGNYLISLDSDGQHMASDLVGFVEAIKKNQDAIIIGGRKLENENKQAKSVFANKFANFWFKVQTLQTCRDTQSGYRLYPIRKIGNINFFTNRYEFELEVLVRAAWKNISIITIPINVYYPPEKERITHFRPVVDFARISLLNTILCVVAIFYGYPSMLIRKIF